MVVDSTLQFAAKRNVPVRYNRDLVASTLKAMKRVTEIRERRERRNYKERMKGNKERQRAANRKLVAEQSHLLPIEPTRAEGEDLEMVEKQRVKVNPVFGKEKLSKKSRLLVSGDVMDVEEHLDDDDDEDDEDMDE